jgi:glycosyltransferase involved in cell wall biosynthesis
MATGFRKDARQISGSLDVFVLPSLKREGLPRSVIEAMSQGVPAIVSDAGGSPEVVEHGKTGYVVPAGDARAISLAIEGLLSEEEKYKAFSAASRQRIQANFNIDQTVAKTLKLYKQLLGTT